MDADILPWTFAARRRRAVFFLLVTTPALIAAHFFSGALAADTSPLAVDLIGLVFFVLYAWTAAGFWVATAGFVQLMSRPHDGDINPPDLKAPLPKTAILMPICHENVDRVYAGLRATLQSLRDTGCHHAFDFFILSDSRDPDYWMAEEWAWNQLVAEGGSKVYYRRRKTRLKAKSGNISDFCRRWGSLYPYAIVLDADSVMSGETLVRLARLMEANPILGMIQTNPRLVNRDSLFARMQQFAARLYGPIYGAGLHFWQLGDGHYIGHNAIIRLDPFMRHCALPALPGKPPLGGHILSHDFVEAALMRRAGYGVWLDHASEGSYEETPSTLLDDLARDRRWCQGNLQHLRLVTLNGLNAAHRLLFVNGALSYLSAPLWAGFILLTGIETYRRAHEAIRYFVPDQFFPIWPISHEFMFLRLLASTLTMLFAPRIMALVLALFDRRTRQGFGGGVALLLNTFLELVISTLLAPIRMWFHTGFVAQILLGRRVSWRSPARKDAPTTWDHAVTRHGTQTLAAAVAAFWCFMVVRPLFWWLSPLFLGFLLSIPLSVLLADPVLGRRARRLGLFRIPEERDPPPVLRALAQQIALAESDERLRTDFAAALWDPQRVALHRMLVPQTTRYAALAAELVEKVTRLGPAALSDAERRTVLSDAGLTFACHHALWRLPSARFEALRQPASAA